MSFAEGEPISLQEFMRIHQLSPDYQAMTDAQRKVFLEELRQAHRDLKKESRKNAVPTGDIPGS